MQVRTRNSSIYNRVIIIIEDTDENRKPNTKLCLCTKEEDTEGEKNL